MKRVVPFVAVCALCALAFQSSAGQRAIRVSLVRDPAAAAPVQHGVESLKTALRAKKIPFEEVTNLQAAQGEIVVVAGSSKETSGVAVPSAPESLAIHWTEWKGKPLLALSGSDDRGLMYGLLEVADRIGWARDPAKPLSEVHDIVESPSVTDRGVTIFTMQQAEFEDRLRDAHYWEKYFDTLARDRFNRFQILFAYEMDGYMCPAYPYFVHTPGFTGVKVEGLSSARQQRNVADLHRLIRMAHDRGIGVTLGFWCHFYQTSTSFRTANQGQPQKGQGGWAKPDQSRSLHPRCVGDHAACLSGSGHGPVPYEPRIRVTDPGCKGLLDERLPGHERSCSESSV
jgi:hypothetical protein